MLPADLYGQRLTLVEIELGGIRTPVADIFDAWVEFVADGQFAVSDSVNVSSGAYVQVPGGFQLDDDMASTTAAYDRRDPSRSAIVDAVDALVTHEGPIDVEAAAASIALTVGGLTARFSR